MRVSGEHLPVPNEFGYVAVSRYFFGPYLSARGIEVHGQENLPSGNAPYILAVNHRSMLDIPIIGQVMLDHDDTQMHYVAKKELWKQRIMAKYLDSTGVIKYDRDKKMKDQPDVVDRMNNVLQNNGVLLMFPEHTRRQGPGIQIEKRGLGMLAVGNHVSIATAGIYNSDSLWGRIVVNFGKTIDTGPLGNDNMRTRMVQMEHEYTESLQTALYGAYQLGGNEAYAQSGGE